MKIKRAPQKWQTELEESFDVAVTFERRVFDQARAATLSLRRTMRYSEYRTVVSLWYSICELLWKLKMSSANPTLSPPRSWWMICSHGPRRPSSRCWSSTWMSRTHTRRRCSRVPRPSACANSSSLEGIPGRMLWTRLWTSSSKSRGDGHFTQCVSTESVL